MANAITSMTTYTGKQSEFRELVMKKLQGFLSLNELGFQIIEDIQSNKIMYKDAYMDKITRKRVSCNNTVTGNGVAISSFTLAVTDMQAQLEQCADVFDATIAEVLRKKGADINDLTATEIETYILERVADAAARDIFRIVLLGDTTLTNADYTAFDGVFKKVKAGFLATDGTVRVAASISDSDLTAANLVATLDAYVTAQPDELKFMPDESKRFYVTDSVYRAYERYLSSTQFSGVAEQRNALVNGIPSLTFRGIPMVNLKVISKYLLQDFNTTSPQSSSIVDNRILLTVPENHYIATDTLTDTARVQMWYEPVEDQNYTRLRYKLGYNYAFGELNVFGGW
tara:strand:+ start:227 stop:1252 length:1026 start_codon:yes stop_codon:yes gene_type:complete